MIDLHIPLGEDKVYDILADGCHDIAYEVGSCFEWQFPEPEGYAVAKWSFRTQDQGIATLLKIRSLLDGVVPSKAHVVLHGVTFSRKYFSKKA